MERVPLAEIELTGGLVIPRNPLSAPANSYSLGSANQVLEAIGSRPWRGLDSKGAGSGSRILVQFGRTWGGIKDIVDMSTTLGSGSLFMDIGQSAWGIGAGQVAIEGIDIPGFTLSSILQVLLLINNSYLSDDSGAYDAGLPQPSAPDVAIIATPGGGNIGEIDGPVSFKIARLRNSTGARSVASTTSAVVVPQKKTVRITFPLPSAGQKHWALFATQQGFGGVGLHYRLGYQNALDIPESLIGGIAQVETATVIGTITGDGDAEVIVTALGMTNSPKTIPVAVLTDDTALDVAEKIRTGLALDVDVSAFFTVSGSGANVVLTRLATGADDATMNVSIDNDTCTGLTNAPTSVDTRAGTAANVIEGVPRSIEIDYKDGDLIPEFAYIDDYPPPAGTHAVRLENVMCVLGAYADASTSPTSTNPGTCGAISLPNFYESFKPRNLVYFPGQVVSVLTRPTDSYAYVAAGGSVLALQYVGLQDGPACAVTLVWPDISIAKHHNWCQAFGLIFAWTEGNGLVRMNEDGGVDYGWGAEIREFTRNWDDSTVVAVNHKSKCVVVSNGNTSFDCNLENDLWSPAHYFRDAGVEGNALSATTYRGQMVMSVDDEDVHTAYDYDTGATEMLVTTETANLFAPSRARTKTVSELALAFETDNTNSIIVAIHRNMRKTFVRDGSCTSGSNLITSLTASWDTNHTGDMACLFGEDVGGMGIDFLIGRIQYQSSTVIQLLNPTTGLALNVSANLTNAYLLIAHTIKEIATAGARKQFIQGLRNFLVQDAYSFQVSIVLRTSAVAGQVLSITPLGNVQGAYLGKVA